MKKYPNDLIGDIMKAFGKYADRPAFVIEDTACTYGELATCVQKISSLFKDREDKIIGIVAENRLETYASILSALICGKTYVILHPFYPKHRNDRIADSAGIRLVLHTENIHVLNLDTRNLELICTSEIEQAENSATFHAAEDILHTAEEENAYIIFTSGSTGEPKGVPISRRNLNAFYTAYHRLGWQLDENDRMLQMFELTFDVSIVSFLYPLMQRAQIAVIFGKTLDNGKRSPCRSVHRILSPFALSQYLPQLPALQIRRRETPIRLRVHIADITVNYLKYTAPMENVKSFSKNFYEMLPLFCCSGSA